MKSEANSLSFLKKLHIIFIIPFSPKYEFITQNPPPPIHSWQNPKGEMIGVWEEDFGHYFGFNLLNYYPEIKFEVWRPDYRADKVYEHIFDNGLIHRSFPEVNVNIQIGLVKRPRVYAPLMEKYLEEIAKGGNQDTIIMLHATNTAFSKILFPKFSHKLPMLGYHFDNNDVLFFKAPRTKNFFKFIHYKFYALQYKKELHLVRHISLPHWNRIEEFQQRYGCNVWFNQLGIDLEFWKPDINIQEARTELELPSKKIILFASRLVPEYQIDKVLDIISKFRNADFLCVFTASGPEDYLTLLNHKIRTLKIENHVRFVGLVDILKLKKYFAACDVFCSTGIYNAGPGSTFFAMLMEKPVMSTDSGLATEILNKYGCGNLFPPTDYSKWEEAFSLVIENDEININKIDRQIIADLMNWDIRIKGWIDTFHSVLQDFKLTNN